MQYDLNDKDRAIVSMLQIDPETSQIEMSRKLGISQPSISARLKRLKKKGVIALQAGMNLRKVDLHLAKVELAVKSESNKLIEAFIHCPYFINGFITAGKYNLLFIFVGENISTLEAIVDNRLRPWPQVTDIAFSVITAPIKDFIAPINSFLNIDASIKGSPCGAKCMDCEMYTSNRCLGCPATKEYRGSLWKKPKI